MSVFPYSHTQNISHADLLEVLENDESGKKQFWLEYDTATVFVAQDAMSRFIRLKDMLVPSLGMRRPFRRCGDRRSMDDGGDFRSGLAAV